MTSEGVEIQVVSSVDSETQSCKLWVPSKTDEPVPMLVFLHSWSGNWKQDNSDWMEECQTRGWIFLHPDFRGPNIRKEACGSGLAQSDILDAISFVKKHCNVDSKRVFLAGTSGGGHMSLLMAGKHSDEFAAVSAWCGISSLADWHDQTSKMTEWSKYAGHIETACGGKPGTSEAVDKELANRSPLSFLSEKLSIPVDINAGINDGHSGSVPISHSIDAFNNISADETDVTQEQKQLLLDRNPESDWKVRDDDYGVEIHFRRTTNDVQKRLTIFEGGHEDIPKAAMKWFDEHAQGR